MTSLHRYITFISALGMAVLVAVVATTDPSQLVPHNAETWVLAIALVVGECLPMRIVHHGSEGEITTSSTFALALLLTAGAPAAMIVMTVAAIAADLRQRKSVSRMLFNVGQYALVVLASSFALSLFSDLNAPAGTFGPDDLLGSLAAASTFFVVNAVLVTRAVVLVEGAPFWRYLRTDLSMQTSTVGILLGLGPVVVITAEFSLLALPLLALPLIALHASGRRAVDHQHDALHDVLTGLPNRTLLQDRVEQALALARREGHRIAVMLLDLDRFKEINDTLGHQQGDEVLCGVAERLRTELRESDTVARLGGDEYAIVLRRIATSNDATEIARQLATAIDSPFTTRDGLDLDVCASIGIAIAPDDGEDAGTLLRKADIAMYQAKQGDGSVSLYTPESDESTPERLRMVADLKVAIERRELVMHFQPKVSLSTGRVEALEALVRWQHPRLGLLQPAEFLDTAERSGLMAPITSLALDAALIECRAWLDAGLDIGVAVNLPPQALRDERIVGEVSAALERFGVPGRLLQLELTEESFVTDARVAGEVLGKLRALGIEVAIDDFGTGYSSLAHLSDLPVNELKIDRRFVAGLGQDSAEAAIVRSTIALAHELGLRVVAEGVETSAVLAELSALGCDAVQGFLLGRPTPASSVWPILNGPDPRTLPVAA